MARHWQRKPLLVRQAFPGFISPLTPNRLFELAGDEELGAESRLIRQSRGRWSLAHGPFEAGQLPTPSTRQWTLLVQGMDLHDDAIRALLDQFRFIADARLDDLMISYATDGGGVGPHLDSYDVFLIQAHGKRRWRYGRQTSDAMRDDVPLKILREFTPDHDELLEPGDMLYLPPGWAHDGVAVGECMTFSVGFRAPSRHELLAAWLAECADEPINGPDPRYRDPGAAPTARPARIPDSLHQTLSGWIRGWKPDSGAIERFIGAFLTEPKPNVWFEGAEPPLNETQFAKQAARRGLVADRRTRLAYRGARLFINGECFETDPAQRRLLRALADDRALPPGALNTPPVAPGLIDLLHQWFDAGWIRLAPEAPATDQRKRKSGR